MKHSAANQIDAVVAVQRCMSDIPTWMLTDKLKLNDDKTEFMLLGTKQQLFKVNIDSLTVGSIDVAPVTVARNLGTWFDSNLNLQGQIHNTCKSEFFHLYNIWRIRKYLSQESARTLVHAFIIGRIDYCHSLLFLIFYLLFIYLNCNACRMQLLGLYLMFLATVI